MRNILIGFALLIALSVIPSTAVSQISVEQVPAVIDSSNQAGWWEPLALHNNEVFLAFNKPGPTGDTHEVTVGRKDSNGVWSFADLLDSNGGQWSTGDDLGHDQPTIAVDGDGYIHIFADLHDFPLGLHYWRSNAPRDISNMRLDLNEVGNSSQQYTYPVADTSPNGDVYLMIRNRAIGRGVGELYRFNNSSDQWSLVSRFADASSDNGVVYPDDLTIDPQGNVHIAFSFAAGTPNGLRHYGSYLKYIPSNNTFVNAAGSAVSTPVSYGDGIITFQGLESQENFTAPNPGQQIGGKGFQSAKIDLYSSGNTYLPTITYRYRDDPNAGATSGARSFSVYRTRWKGGDGWTPRDLIFSNGDTVAALGHTHNGSRVRSYFVQNSPKQLKVAQRGGGNPDWVTYDIAQGEPIERIGVIRNGNTDFVYGSAVGTGELFLIQVGNDLNSLPVQPPPAPGAQSCLSGTLSGTVSGTVTVQSSLTGEYLSGDLVNGLANLSSTITSKSFWRLQDSNSDGEFAFINDDNGTSVYFSNVQSLAQLSTGSFGDANRRWTFQDNNADGDFGIRNVGITGHFIDAPDLNLSNQVTSKSLWKICPAQ